MTISKGKHYIPAESNKAEDTPAYIAGEPRQLTYPSYLGHHTNWGLNMEKLVNFKRPPQRLKSHEVRRLERTARRKGKPKPRMPYLSSIDGLI